MNSAVCYVSRYRCEQLFSFLFSQLRNNNNGEKCGFKCFWSQRKISLFAHITTITEKNMNGMCMRLCGFLHIAFHFTT